MYPSTPFESRPTYKAWDWGRFDIRNNLWANEMDRLAPRGRTANGSGSVAYMNITDMARPRPDAHDIMSPGSPDCLHWQVPGVPNAWVQMLWDMVGVMDLTR
ncbi:BZ3500_MvSof-1268-A1-R1_Chr10-1g02551 [Microbotryum saponariae]|uniref:BZ3500_MvSof-1268-A1-R1_Chr10-1g02551 protein n=1 Tax=Microbotryum saponariae TaxID=289078 RepID=A0A2X0LLA9_9BASI|nr:BZ3500_MvSof-1268-A1-R1_Chr10-1g02551 [Microbotryum saponariae]SDA06040.1 BZ3501_MvSof-1269-A2-R1_Chr10-1g02152 [Microbotryum saponariae]